MMRRRRGIWHGINADYDLTAANALYLIICCLSTELCLTPDDLGLPPDDMVLPAAADCDDRRRACAVA
jgi:hypothetical protein